MTVTLDLPPETEAAVMREAEARGLPVPDYLLSLIEARPPTPDVSEQLAKNQAAIAFLRQIRQEDETDDSEEIARRERDWEEFARLLDEDRLSYRKLFP